MKLLIIRGWRSKKEHWQRTIEILKKNNIDVLLPDLPGVSDKLEINKPWSIEDYKNWLLEYTKEKGWEKFNVLGHSFGGAIAAKLAADNPERIEKLILCAPAVVGTTSPRTILFYLTAQTAKAFFSLPPFKRGFLKTKEKLASFGIGEYYFEEGTRKQILKMAAKEKHKENLKKIKKETLILWGSEDNRIPLKNARKLKKIIPNSKIIILPLINHNPNKENPKGFAKEIIEFII